MPTTEEVIPLLQASALSERSPAQVPDDVTRPRDGVSPGGPAAAWARRALEGDGVFDGYLRSQGLETEQLNSLLSGAPWSPREGTVEWIRRVGEWLHPVAREYENERDEQWIPGTLVVENTRVESLPFSNFFRPMVLAQTAFLDRWPWMAGTVRQDVLDNLAQSLATLSIRCLIADLSGDRSVGAYARMDAEFAHREGRSQFFARYPVLARDLVCCIGSWRSRLSNLLGRLKEDEGLLRDSGLLRADAQSLESVHFAGDSHGGGQSVAIIDFAGGDSLVFKPRECTAFSIYRQMNELIADDLPNESRLVCPRALIREGCGWIEFIGHANSGSVDLSAHLHRLGALLAIAHVLGASDLHLENVIASSQGPVPIDVETLLQNRSLSSGGSLAVSVAAGELNRSVLGTGILPVQLTAGENTSIDVSVITGGLQEDRSATVHQLLDPGTDRMRIAAVDVPIGQSQNQPIGMTRQFVRSHRSEVGEGFARTYRAILSHREEIGRILSATSGLSARQIVRATRSYSLLLTEMRQATRLRSGIDRDHLLRSLWTRLADHAGDGALIRAEAWALRRLDVPLFTVGIDSCALESDGEVVDPGYFTRTMREDALERLYGLGEPGLQESLRLIDEAILAATPNDIDESTRGGDLRRGGAEEMDSSPLATPTDASKQAVVLLAEAEVERLLSTAIWGQDDVTWISVCSSTDSTGLEYRPIGPTLYDGLAGIVFASTCAHQVFPDMGLDDVATKAVGPVSSILDDWSQGRMSLPIGAYSGAAGLLYALSHYDAKLGDGRHQVIRSRAIDCIISQASGDEYLDVMAGTAGAIAVLSSLSEIDGRDVSDAIGSLSRRLIEKAVRLDDGSFAWETGIVRSRLGGFSHGSTGIGWALSRAARVLGGDPEIANAAHNALRFDDSLYDPKLGRWEDARPESRAEGRVFPMHWCHGAAGIAMARAATAINLETPALGDLALRGAQETVADRLPADDSLCHGTLGNLLAMREVESSLQAEIGADDFAMRAIDRLRLSGARSGLPAGITTVRGLMLGTAGTLYALVREIDRDLPNVLLLEL